MHLLQEEVEYIKRKIDKDGSDALCRFTPFLFLVPSLAHMYTKPSSSMSNKLVMLRIGELFSPGFESGIGGGKNLREGCGGL